MRKLLLGLTLALSLALPASAALPTGARAPDIVTTGALGGKAFRLHLKRELRKGPVVLYFFPKAFTCAPAWRNSSRASLNAFASSVQPLVNAFGKK